MKVIDFKTFVEKKLCGHAEDTGLHLPPVQEGSVNRNRYLVGLAVGHGSKIVGVTAGPRPSPYMQNGSRKDMLDASMKGFERLIKGALLVVVRDLTDELEVPIDRILAIKAAFEGAVRKVLDPSIARGRTPDNVRMAIRAAMLAKVASIRVRLNAVIEELEGMPAAGENRED